MEHHEVLAKLFQVSHRLHEDRVRHMEMETANAIEADLVRISKMQTLPNSSHNILRLLKEAENLNQRTLATQMGISAQAVSEAVKKLVQCGYVTKVVGAQNNENRIALTQEGREVAEKLDRRIKSHASVVLGSLNQEELMQLDKLLCKLL